MNGLDLKCAHEHHTPLSTEYVATGNSTCCRLVEKNYRTTRQFRHRNARSAHPQQETICTSKKEAIWVKCLIRQQECKLHNLTHFEIVFYK
jgi:hypothetical protein